MLKLCFVATLCTLTTLMEGASTTWSFWLCPHRSYTIYSFPSVTSRNPSSPVLPPLSLLLCGSLVRDSALALVASILRGFGVWSILSHSSQKLFSLYPGCRPTKPGCSNHFLICHFVTEALKHPPHPSPCHEHQWPWSFLPHKVHGPHLPHEQQCPWSFLPPSISNSILGFHPPPWASMSLVPSPMSIIVLGPCPHPYPMSNSVLGPLPACLMHCPISRSTLVTYSLNELTLSIQNSHYVFI